MVDSGQAGYDGPVMNDLPIPDSRHAIFRIGKILARKLSSAVFFPLVLRESAGGG